ncbi:hypothetical protein A0J61_02283, partial [Choanephora cucurbitarum]
MKSPIIKRKDNRGIPVVSPSRPSHSTSLIRKKTKAFDHQDDSVNDEVLLCRVRSTEHYATPDSPSQRQPIARMYHQSPHRLVSSPGIHSDSWQDASTEPIITKATCKSPNKLPSTIATQPPKKVVEGVIP